MKDNVRTHVILPRELVEEIDGLVGQRQRSAFVTEAIRDKLQHRRQSAALKRAAGSINLADYPEWETPEKISEWVHNLRYGAPPVAAETGPESDAT